MKSATNVVSVSGHRSEPDFPDLLHAVNGPSQRSEAACIDLVRQRDEITHRLGKILRDQEQRIQELTRQLKEAHEHAAKCVKAGEEAIKAAEAAVKDAQ